MIWEFFLVRDIRDVVERVVKGFRVRRIGFFDFCWFEDGGVI